MAKEKLIVYLVWAETSSYKYSVNYMLGGIFRAKETADWVVKKAKDRGFSAYVQPVEVGKEYPLYEVDMYGREYGKKGIGLGGYYE